MSNILFLKDKPDFYLLDIKENDKTVKTIYIFKSYNHLKNSILNNIENKIITTYNSKLKRESSYLLKKEIDESLKKRMIHLPNLSLENNKNITVFEIFTKEQTLTLDSFNKDYIKELIDKYKLSWVEGSFKSYKSLNFYQVGLIFKLKDQSNLNKDLKINLKYGENNLCIDNIHIKDKGQILLDYELVNGLFKVNNIKLINNNSSSEKDVENNKQNTIPSISKSKINNLKDSNDFKIKASNFKINSKKIQ